MWQEGPSPSQGVEEKRAFFARGKVEEVFLRRQSGGFGSLFIPFTEQSSKWLHLISSVAFMHCLILESEVARCELLSISVSGQNFQI